MNIGQATEIYSAKLNGLSGAREVLDAEELEKYEEDLRRTWDELVTAWCDGLVQD